MSNSYIVEPQESGSKKDDTLIIVVNDDGTISVDQETFQNLIMNQANANVSVVRLGQTDGDAENGDITLTVDPPSYVPPESAPPAVTTGSTDPGVAGLVDPFMEMDPEQLERLETALQSEEAKQILGENVTAMLDMLSVEEEQNSIRHSIQLDHCYTSRKSPSDPKPSDPLPTAESPDVDDTHFTSPTSTSLLAIQTPTSSLTSSANTTTKTKVNKAGKTPGRPRRGDGRTMALGGVTSTPKTAGTAVSRTALNMLQQGVNKGALVPLIKPLNMNDVHMLTGTNEENVEDDAFASSSSESSESEPPSDDDSDFGPRGTTKRGGVRARGGRKGLTTRGGSMAATRRRGTNKQMDMEQVRRLDMEMAAAVDAMKSPEKDEKVAEKVSPVKAKKQLRIAAGRKKDEPPITVAPTPTTETPTVYEKPLQTTNQVKANLINANMFKGDMILTKPGQMKNNQKVIFVQKQVMMKDGELKNFGLKKQIVVSKANLLNPMNTKITAMKDGKLLTMPMTSKVVTQQIQTTPPKVTAIQSGQLQQQQQPPQQQLQKVATSTVPVKIKAVEVKKEKKKSESLPESLPKVEAESVKPAEPSKPAEPMKSAEPKTPDGKKHQKREHRKSPAHFADALGPALFSTPDIIRRVGSTGEPKTPDTPLTPSTPNNSTSFTPTSSSAPPNFTATATTPVASSAPLTPTTTAESDPASDVPSSTPVVTTINESKMGGGSTLDQSMHEELEDQFRTETQPKKRDSIDEHKAEVKAPLAEELQLSLDPASKSAPPEEILQPTEQPIVPDHIVSESTGIEGEEHLLATLEMEASKHEEELLAEALLLHEELGVDLADHAALVDHASPVAEPLVPAPTFAASVMTPVQQVAMSPVPPAPASPSIAGSESNKKAQKEEKEPIQIVRGGRVITLPPIEAPATRSKRLQVKSDVQKKVDANKKNDKAIQGIQQPQQLKQDNDMDSEMDDDEDDDDDDEGGNSDSEDDPDRLWCICKRPHNNRFMICCDVCEDWFHGKCVHVSKAMGQQMEEKGIEWVCPNCTKKKTEEAKIKPTTQQTAIRQQKSAEHPMQQSVVQSQVSSPNHAAATSTPNQTPPPSATLAPVQTTAMLPGVTQCVVCKKEARNSSIYCSDACILTHAQESLTKDKPAAPSPLPQLPPQAKSVKAPVQDTPKTKPDARVIVFERRTGKVLTGADAPTTSNLKVWLKENPTYEVVRPNNLNTLQIGGKTVTAIQTQGVGKITKSTQQVGGKMQTQPRMIYSKVMGSKQTVIASSNKKMMTATSSQQQQQTNSPQHMKIAQLRQTMLTPTLKNPTIAAKQVTPKASPQQQQKPQTAITPKQVQNKKQEVRTPPSQQKAQVKLPVVKKYETEPIRLNIRKTLAELLSSRIKEAEDLKLTEEDITELALNIELEMFKFFKDTGAKYKAKYRSLVFNIKDTKNLTLFRKIADKSLTPDAVVRLSPDEMASQELAEWREKETKHQLEMIKKNELDLMAQAKSIVVKTHKGEQIIENDGAIDRVDPKTPVQDIVTALNSGDGITSTVEDEKEKEREKDDFKKLSLKSVGDEKKKKEKEKERVKERGRAREKDRVKDKQERSRSRSRRHRSRDRERSKTRERSRDHRATKSKDSRREKDRERERDKDKDKEREKEKDRERDKDKERDKQKDKDKHRRSKSSTRNRSRARHREYKEKDKKEEERKKEGEKKDEPTLPAMDKPIEDRLWRHIEEETTTNTFDGNESDVSDREPTSTVTIKTPDINEEPEKDREEEEVEQERDQPTKGTLQTVWRGFVNMVDVAKFFITAQEVSGVARDLMEDLPDTVDVVGRISHETVWDYISKMKKTGSKEILVIRLTAANDEEKIPYITLYSYLNSRSRLGVVGNVSKNIKDFYIMPLSSQSLIPQVLLPLDGPGFEDHRPHLLLGIIVRNKRKRMSTVPPTAVPAKVAKKEPERSYTPPLVDALTKGKTAPGASTPPMSPKDYPKKTSVEIVKDKQTVTQMTLESLNKAHVGMSKSGMDSAKMSKIVPELSTKMGLASPENTPPVDDGDEPYSPGGLEDELEHEPPKVAAAVANVLSPTKNSTELQRKMDELNRQIEEQKQQIQSISSSFLGDTTATLPGLGHDPSGNDSEEAYSPSDARSFTPPPPGISKLTQPLLDKVSDITIPANLQEILANVKRQESSKVDPYLPSKPSATFLTSVNAAAYQKIEKYSPCFPKAANIASRAVPEKPPFDIQQAPAKESKSKLRSLSDLDLIKKAEEELAAVAAVSPLPDMSRPPPMISPSITSIPPPVATLVPHIPPPMTLPPPPAPVMLPTPVMVPPPLPVLAPLIPEPADGSSKQLVFPDPLQMAVAADAPKPLEHKEESSEVPCSSDGTPKSTAQQKFIPKSGVVLCVKRKAGEDGSPGQSKTPRTKSRWGQGPPE